MDEPVPSYCSDSGGSHASSMYRMLYLLETPSNLRGSRAVASSFCDRARHTEHLDACSYRTSSVRLRHYGYVASGSSKGKA